MQVTILTYHRWLDDHSKVQFWDTSSSILKFLVAPMLQCQQRYGTYQFRHCLPPTHQTTTWNHTFHTKDARSSALTVKSTRNHMTPWPFDVCTASKNQAFCLGLAAKIPYRVQFLMTQYLGKEDSMDDCFSFDWVWDWVSGAKLDVWWAMFLFILRIQFMSIRA